MIWDAWRQRATRLDLQGSKGSLHLNHFLIILTLLPSPYLKPFLPIPYSTSFPVPKHHRATPTASNVSGSDPETPAPKRYRNGIGIPGATAKVSKRKSRSSRRSQTTFITADPANFRQMVQQVTGVRFGNAQFSAVPVLKPEPQRPGSRLHGPGGCLPTLDTSAFLLDHHHQQQMVVGSGVISGPVSGSGTVSFPQAAVTDGGPGPGLDYETCSSFPTLDSWN
ncbi:hypothetical protein GH714_005663 [Hevea brasiliensis]|uniref:VQ domain-containing protein n=1 Tax=Hevea brasiliensis TaxID=3981 RepID=A0A6A6LWW8_HEVBR|nr:hypothetical protein GH714_005663 [Hevea brasiliensis]